ncbi:hypothetical protein E1B28_012707 [Marasmius oreades]|uniref:Uncharacterized protein n=1 Tax=Marasmius oreades TaxID=181124 RepID=A0A9P7RS55_9AGAR|nr:uncharacterized protein E1B28_012707 [Marasmius oreades]KAG7088739.1 hypothetical protein E1B28_012707 [Marasmius oreades]
MPSRSAQTLDEYPSLLWITIPPILLLSAWFARKWYKTYQLKVHGIGKGAPGFQTNVRRVRITPEIAARIRRGEEVSPDEIAAASALAGQQEIQSDGPRQESIKPTIQESVSISTPANEWLPEAVTTPKKRGKGRKK